MVLVVEDGTGLSNANSYVSVADTKAYAAARNQPLTGLDSAIEGFLIRATDYLETLSDRWQGSRSFAGQALAWPRYDVLIDGIDWPGTMVPYQLKRAAMQLCMDLANGIDLMPTLAAGAFVKRERVGPIETEYSETTGSVSSPQLTAAMAYLKPLFSLTGRGFTLVTQRI